MDTRQCDRLDDYLAGWLSADEAASFEAHLADCPACRAEVAHGQRIDRLLAQGSGHLEPVPPSLVDRIEGRIRSLRRRRTVRWALGASAAAAVVLAVGVWHIPQDEGAALGPERPPGRGSVAETPVESEPGGHEVAPPAQPPSDNEPRVRVSLADPSEAILVRKETSNPNVSIVWIYPTVRPGRVGAGPAAGSP